MGKFEKKPERRSSQRREPQHYDARYGQQQPTQARRQASRRKAAARKRTVLLVSIAVTVVLIVAVFAAFTLLRDDGKIVGNLYVAGVDVGGMTKEQAKAAITERLKIYDENTMQVELYGKDCALYTTTYDPDKVQLVDIFGKPMDPGGATENSSDPSEEPTEPSESTTPSESTEPSESEPADAPLDENGEPLTYLGRFSIAPQDANVTLDVDAAVEAAYKYGRSTGLFSRLKEKTLPSRHDLEASGFIHVDEAKLRELMQQANEKFGSTLTESSVKANTGEEKSLTITLGSKGSSIDADALYEQLLTAYLSAEFRQKFTMTETYPAPVDLDKLYGSYCTAPVNAVCDEDTYEITDEKLGFGFEMQKAIDLLNAAKPGQTVTLALGELEPQYTREKLESQLFCDVLGYVESPHSYNPPRTRNLELACEQIDGMILKPGDTFSFNKVVGQRTAERGFQEAAVYVGSDTVDQLGGGVCQVASTIYYCTLQAELEVIERTEHRYTPAYIPWGMDATIYWGSLDYRFRNNTNYPIRIEAKVTASHVIMKFVGTETRDYTLKLEYVVLSKDPWEEEEVEMTPEEAAAKGYSDGEEIVDPYTGAKVKTYKYKYDKDGNELSCEYIDSSSYARRDKQVVKIIYPTEPPTEPTTEPTEPEPSSEPTEPDEP